MFLYIYLKYFHWLMKYISRFKCKEIRKKYVIPNKNWFTSLNKLDIFTEKKHDLLKLLTNEI